MIRLPSPAPPRRFEVVLNRGSGTLKSLWHDGLPSRIADSLSAVGVEATVRAYLPEEMDVGLRSAVEAAPDAIIVGGGDGSVSAAAALLAGGDIPMGILPCGTFNLAARDFGVPLDLDEAISDLAGAPVQAVDLLDVGGHACLCTAVIGFYPALARREEEYHGQAWWRKSLHLVAQTLSAWRHTVPLDLEIDTKDGKHIRETTRFTTFVPGEYVDLFSVMPRRAELASGTLTIYLSRHRTLLALTRGSLAYLFGLLNTERDIRQIQTCGVRLRVKNRRSLAVMIDGEILDLKLPLELNIRPRALKVLSLRENKE